MLILLSIFYIYKIMEVEMDKLFKLKENNTSVRTEVVAGIKIGRASCRERVSSPV